MPAARGQGNALGAPTFFADVAGDQLGDVLGRSAVPEGDSGQLLVMWRRSRRRDGSCVAKWARIQRRPARLHGLYLGDAIERATNHPWKADLADHLAAAPQNKADDGATGKRLARFLAEVESAWAAATPAERDRPARELFDEVLIDNRTEVAVRPRPELRPFFSLADLPEKSSDPDPGESGSGSESGCQAGADVTQWRK